ncbi:MAG: TonB-dependent receptor [Porphyromonas sp.]|nr:TonB-dependent receptor [Porphyromonas sp.]
MNKFIGLSVGLLLTITFSATAHNEPTDSTTNSVLDEVVVVATRTPKALKEIPTITHVLSAAEIKRVNPRTVTDLLLATIPGIQISQHGSQQRMSIQGLSADYMLFLVDGERLTNEGNGTVDLERIDPNNIERIEIIRGAASALYGSNAIGGVINIITKKATKSVEGVLRTYYSHNNIFRSNVLFGGKWGHFSSTTTGGYSKQQEYTVPNGDDVATVPDVKTCNIGQKFTYADEDHGFKARLNGTYSHRLQGFDDKVKYLYNNYTAGSQFSYLPNDTYSLDASYHIEGYVRDKLFFTAETDRISPVFSFLTHTARVQLNREASERNLPNFNVGYETVIEGLRSDQFKDKNKRYRAYTNTLYAQSDWQLNEIVTVTFGLRQDIHSAFGVHLTPRAALMLRKGLFAVRFSYSEGFRSPTLKELYMDWDHRGMFTIKGNENLRPETSRQFAIAPEFTYNKLNITAMLYANVINHRIITQYKNNNTVLEYLNSTGLSRLYGTQATLRWQISRPLMLNLNYSYVYDYEPAKGQDGREANLSVTPPHSITGTLSYRYECGRYSVEADLSGRFFSGLTTYVYNEETKNYTPNHLPSFAHLRMGITQEWSRFVSLTVGVDNLLNFRAPRIGVNTPLSPGRNFYSSLSLRF